MTKMETSNKRSNDSEIKFKGVRKRKWGKWVSEIRLPNSRERIWLGSYDSPEKAARAFDAAQFCLRGKSANFNFPDNPPDISGGRAMTPAEIQAAASRFANTVPDSDPGSGRVDQLVVEDNNNNRTVEIEEYSLSYSPSISDGTTVEMDGFEMGGVETSFHEQLSLSTQLGSGNYASDFGFTGFNDFINYGEFYTLPQDNNFDYGTQESQDDTYNASFYQNSSLWNF